MHCYYEGHCTFDSTATDSILPQPPSLPPPLRRHQHALPLTPSPRPTSTTNAHTTRPPGSAHALQDLFEFIHEDFPVSEVMGKPSKVSKPRAPKVKAMQIINDLEPHSRGIYGGCIGYVGFNGNLNQAITIRTFISKNNKLYMQAGAGIVSKSHPETELSEVKHKLGALKKALDQAEGLNK